MGNAGVFMESAGCDLRLTQMRPMDLSDRDRGTKSLAAKVFRAPIGMHGAVSPGDHAGGVSHLVLPINRPRLPPPHAPVAAGVAARSACRISEIRCCGTILFCGQGSDSTARRVTKHREPRNSVTQLLPRLASRVSSRNSPPLVSN